MLKPSSVIIGESNMKLASYLSVIWLCSTGTRSNLVKNFLDSNQISSPYSKVDGDNYEYAYSVDQPDSNFGQIEAKEGKDVVGAYEVSNAHGQQQSISYSVSDNSGFNANVTYKHPDGYMYR
ncbi:hypothetical protein TCAL_16913 [Tigriopus californicus]|uniref:Uncharacterized protein n=1 Tax=Tigriopus californicus TaxID=6832 RepID=A0A553P6U4_TIGCA|nr:hypothetical protein TCAL_16913 [Tigriopus californicus]